MKSYQLYSAFTLLGLLFSVTLRARVLSDDLRVYSGAAVSRLQVRTTTPQEQAFEETDQGSTSEAIQEVVLGGFPLGAEITIGKRAGYKSFFGGSLLIDIPNSQVSKTEFNSGVLWSLYGGPESLKNTFGDPSSTKLSRSWGAQVSLLFEVSLNQYSASTEDLSVQITGSTFEFAIGLRARSEFYDIPYNMQLSSSILSLPAGSDRLASQTVDLVFLFKI